MKTGPHTHYCPLCREDVECPAVTHCQLPDVYICFTAHDMELVEQFIAATHKGRVE